MILRDRDRLNLPLIFLFFIFTIPPVFGRGREYSPELYFDRNVPEYETVLQPTDFMAMSELEEHDRMPADEPHREAMYNPELFEGDIANELNATTVPLFVNGATVQPGAQKDEMLQLNAIRDRRQLWKGGRIPYAISSQYSPLSRSVIAAAMQEYTKNTCIQWSPRTTADHDYVYILPDRGCYSMVGRMGGRQVLSLGQGCIHKGTIMHEMMHATGFFHEQSRPDRDAFVTILWDNIQPGMQGQFDKYSTAIVQTLGADYDYSSIMHYDPVAFSKNGQPTIVPRRAVRIGQRSQFSPTDAHKINTLYECSPGGVTQSPATVATAAATQRPLIFGGFGGFGSYYTARPPVAVSQTSTPTPTAATTLTTVEATLQNNATAPVAKRCVNKRPDCDQLGQQGWCQRNAAWMLANCPLSCGQAASAKCNTESGQCEDLRVDCVELVKRRFCITAEKFSRDFCARSCGYCFAPPSDAELAKMGSVTSPPSPQTTTSAHSSTTPMAVTLAPSPIEKHTKPPHPLTFNRLVTTFRPKSTVVQSTTTATSTTGKPRFCKDRSPMCYQWKKSGYCQGLFAPYMKNTCPVSCGLC